MNFEGEELTVIIIESKLEGNTEKLSKMHPFD